MHLHIVGGFLGSGKTTAIIGAAKLLMAQGKRVGVVTNDQGKYLVDTAFFTRADVPTVEVTGGCFCCHYDDLDARLAQLQQMAQPDVIFAESVGSCADIDYARYGAGEAQLAWLDETVTLHVAEGQGRAVALYWIGAVVEALRQQRVAVGHLKFLVRDRAGDAKVSFLTLDEVGWEQAVPALTGAQVTLLVNARAEIGAPALRDLVARAVHQTEMATGATLDESEIAFFHPRFPHPTHRMN